MDRGTGVDAGWFKMILYIPYDLAYGGRDAGKIKPFSNLIFEVELLDIEK